MRLNIRIGGNKKYILNFIFFFNLQNNNVCGSLKPISNKNMALVNKKMKLCPFAEFLETNNFSETKTFCQTNLTYGERKQVL